MRTFFRIIIMSCSFCLAKGADEQVANNTTIVVGTNVVCSLSIDPINGWDVGPAPVCFVRLANSAKPRVWGLQLSAEKLFDINLVDTNGEFAEKTEYGRQFGHPLTQKEINDWFVPKRIAHGSMAECFWVDQVNMTHIGSFSIPKAFKLTHTGEYTLCLKMRLIQACVSNPEGTIRTNILDAQYFGPSRTAPTVFQSIWLPEVTAKIEIH